MPVAALGSKHVRLNRGKYLKQSDFYWKQVGEGGKKRIKKDFGEKTRVYESIADKIKRLYAHGTHQKGLEPHTPFSMHGTHTYQHILCHKPEHTHTHTHTNEMTRASTPSCCCAVYLERCRSRGMDPVMWSGESRDGKPKTKRGRGGGGRRKKK